jgi:ribosomal RNA-processing protein 9
MVDPFFKSKKPANSRPRPAGNNNNRPRTNGNGSLQKRKRNNTLKKNLALDQQLAKNVSSDEESGNEGGPLGDVSDDEDEVEETAEEKRLRLAKLYLEGLKVPTGKYLNLFTKTIC